MNIPETSALLAMLAVHDRRTVGDLDVEVWLDALSDLTFDDCRDAVRQLIRDSGEWITPYLVRQSVKRIRTARLAHVELEVPDANPDDAAAYAQAVKDRNMRVADGLEPHPLPPLDRMFPSPPAQPRPLAITSGPPRTPVTHLPVMDPDRMAQARAELDELRDRSGT